MLLGLWFFCIAASVCVLIKRRKPQVKTLTLGPSVGSCFFMTLILLNSSNIGLSLTNVFKTVLLNC